MNHHHHHQRPLHGTTFYFLNDENDLGDIRKGLERLGATCLQPPRDTHKNVNITHVVAEYVDDWDDSWESARERIENFSTTTTTTTTKTKTTTKEPFVVSDWYVSVCIQRQQLVPLTSSSLLFFAPRRFWETLLSGFVFALDPSAKFVDQEERFEVNKLVTTLGAAIHDLEPPGTPFTHLVGRSNVEFSGVSIPTTYTRVTREWLEECCRQGRVVPAPAKKEETTRPPLRQINTLSFVDDDNKNKNKNNRKNEKKQKKLKVVATTTTTTTTTATTMREENEKNNKENKEIKENKEKEEDSFSSFNGASSLSEFMESMDKRAAALSESKSGNVLPRKKRNTASEYVKNWKQVHAYIKSFVNHQTNLYATAEQRLVEVSQTDATKEYPLEHDKKYKHKWKTELCKLKQYLDKNDNATADKIKAIWSLESSLR